MVTIPTPLGGDDKYMWMAGIKDFYRYYATMMELWDGPCLHPVYGRDVLGAVLIETACGLPGIIYHEDGY